MVDFPFQTQAGQVSGDLLGQFAPGQVARVSWQGVRKDNPSCGQYGYAVLLSNDQGETSPEMRFSLSTASSSVELPFTVPSGRVIVAAFTDSRCSTGALLDARIEVLGAPGECAHGTRLKLGSATAVVLGQTGLAQLLADRGVGFVLQFVLSFAFTVFDLSRLCSSGPGPLPVLNATSPTQSLEFWRRFLEYALWLTHCECIPGTPAPVPPADLAQPQPPGWPTVSPTPCSNSDICATLIGLAQQVAALSRDMAATRELTTLLQRYQLPFAYVRGATHSGLGQSGSFAVSRLIGMEFDATAIPTGQRVLEGVPEYIWDLGWMSILDAQGFIEERRITRGQMTWLPRLMPEALTFGWFFKDGVSGTFTELQAEI